MARIGILIGVMAALVLASLGCPDDQPYQEQRPIDWKAWWSADPPTIFSDARSKGGHAWLVGRRESEGQLLSFENGAWDAISLDGMGVGPLNAVHVFDDGSLVAVGNQGVVLTGEPGAWRVSGAPTDKDLRDVWGSSPDDLWVVGSDDESSELFRFDGVAWKAVEFWSYGYTRARPRAVSGTGPDDVWIVGDDGLVLRWDGTALESHYPETEGDIGAVLAQRDRVFVGGASVAVLSRGPGDGESTWASIDTSATRIERVGTSVWIVGEGYDGFGILRRDARTRAWEFSREADSRFVRPTALAKLPDGSIVAVVQGTLFRRTPPFD